MSEPQTPEHQRLAEDAARVANWKRWGPYLSERQWGTVREDYSANGDAWNYFPHEHARSRAYRWGEDGLLGITDRGCRLCFALALWNGRDPILKERLFGLTNPQGNHGEDVKEWYWYLDATPTHSYLRALYKYPQAEFPYARLIEENARRSRLEREFEINDTGIFEESRYFDVFAEYAKAAPEDVLIRLTIANRGPDPAPLHVLPTLWFRNTWTWTGQRDARPLITRLSDSRLHATHPTLGAFHFEAKRCSDFLFTENETNNARLFGGVNATPFVKDAFHEFVVHGRADALKPDACGTKAAAHYILQLPAQSSVTLRLRLSPLEAAEIGDDAFERIFAQRRAEAEAFYESKFHPHVNAAQRQVMRQACAGLLWSKQYYHYVVRDWLAGDPAMPPPPAGHAHTRNADWPHLFNADILSMPDKWEYPWYAAWDSAFHMIPMSRIDPHFAKRQLRLFLREWYMHPNGQIPAYEWNFSDVNPPVHAWACWRVYKIAGRIQGRDIEFLERCFQKLLMNFTWWVNRKDPTGRHIFAGGFLGLDNIGIFDRSTPLPGGSALEQADGTAWMAFYALTMLNMALELAQRRDGTVNTAYEDMASKFFEHFVQIVDAINTLGGEGLWNEDDGFYYDSLHTDSEPAVVLRTRSLVGMLPLIAVELLDENRISMLPGFKKRMDWFLHHRADLAHHVSYCESGGTHGHRLLAIPSRKRLERLLTYLLDEQEFLSPFGIRSLSKHHEAHPFTLHLNGGDHTVGYVPGESDSYMFGGNSNWRGPVWFPIAYLIVEALERYHHFYGKDFTVELPTGSGNRVTLQGAANEIASRLSRLFEPDAKGHRPCHGGDERYASHADWKDLLLFHEYFHADTGRGCGASHQTGWTALVARLVRKR